MKMKNIKSVFYLTVFMLTACGDQTSLDPIVNNEKLTIIPQPAKVKLNPGFFTIENNTVVYYNNKELLKVAKYMDTKLSGSLGFNMQIKEGSGNGINLMILDVADENL